MNKLTFVVPVAHYHRDHVAQAQAQVDAQTLPCDLVFVHDEERRGPSWARNRGVELATTPLVAFLDADDLLDPTYAEVMTRAWTPGRYVFCNHLIDGVERRQRSHHLLTAPRYDHHVVTCVISRQLFWLVGGFDEALQELEDTEFWLRCTARGACGLHVDQPLMSYTRDGRNSATAQLGPHYQERLTELLERYKFKMCSCENPPPAPPPANSEFPGSILVHANWGGNRTFSGKATGKPYPKTGNGKLIWVDVRDQARQPERLVVADLLTAADDLVPA